MPYYASLQAKIFDESSRNCSMKKIFFSSRFMKIIKNSQDWHYKAGPKLNRKIKEININIFSCWDFKVFVWRINFFKSQIDQNISNKNPRPQNCSDKNQCFLVPIFNFFATLVIEAWAITLVYVVDILNNKTISKRELDLLGKVGSGIIFF